MTERFQRGLVVGKFCPLHLGHESVIRRAIEECAEVIVISYTNPEFPGCEPSERRAWLAARFPQVRALVLGHGGAAGLPHNDADDAIHRRFVARACRDLLGTTVDAVFTSESYGDGFAAALTAFFRERQPAHRAVAHVQVDAPRAAWPVSGTQLRSDIHGQRRFLAPEVYASFVARVALLGGESSGKTTLAAALAAEFRSVWVPEFGRELWDTRGGKLSASDMPDIARTQIAREQAALLQARRFVFCDRTPLTTLFYSREIFGRADPEVTTAALRAYDHTILCTPDFPFVQDGTRRDAAFSQRQHDWYVAELARRGIAWLPVYGSVRERVESFRAHILAGPGRAP